MTHGKWGGESANAAGIGESRSVWWLTAVCLTVVALLLPGWLSHLIMTYLAPADATGEMSYRVRVLLFMPASMIYMLTGMLFLGARLWCFTLPLSGWCLAVSVLRLREHRVPVLAVALALGALACHLTLLVYPRPPF